MVIIGSLVCWLTCWPVDLLKPPVSVLRWTPKVEKILKNSPAWWFLADFLTRVPDGVNLTGALWQGVLIGWPNTSLLMVAAAASIQHYLRVLYVHLNSLFSVSQINLFACFEYYTLLHNDFKLSRHTFPLLEFFYKTLFYL